MKLFKSIDDKFAEIGFEKIGEDQYGVTYKRQPKGFNYIQQLDIAHKSNEYNIVQSYDPNLNDKLGIGNTCVGLTAYEMKLCLQKMKQMGWKIKR